MLSKQQYTSAKEKTLGCFEKAHITIMGEETKDIKASLPADSEKSFTTMHEVILYPNDQYTLSPKTKHWFQAGPKDTVLSAKSRDEADIFTDENIQRTTKIEGEQ